MKNKLYGAVIITALVAGGIGLWGGTIYSKNQQASTFGRFQRNSITDGQGTSRGVGNIRPVSGEVKAIDDKSITVAMKDGSSRFVFFSSSTLFQTMIDTNSSAIKVGTRVNVIGKSNSDGSVTAETVQLR